MTIYIRIDKNNPIAKLLYELLTSRETPEWSDDFLDGELLYIFEIRFDDRAPDLFRICKCNGRYILLYTDFEYSWDITSYTEISKTDLEKIDIYVMFL